MAAAPSGEMWRQRLAQHQPGARQTRLESRPAQPHGRGGLVDGQTLDVPQDHRQAVLRRKSHQLLLDPGADFGPGVQLLRVLGPGMTVPRSERLFLVGPGRARRVETLRVSALPQALHALIDGDARQPGREAGGSLEAADVLERFEKRVLDAVLRLFVVAGDAHQSTVDAAGMGAGPLFERPDGTGAYRPHQGEVVVPRNKTGSGRGVPPRRA